MIIVPTLRFGGIPQAENAIRFEGFGNCVHTTAGRLARKMDSCVDGITTSAHEAGRLLGTSSKPQRGRLSLEREGHGTSGHGQSGQIGAPFVVSDAYCDGMAPQGKARSNLGDALPFAPRFTTGELE